MTTTSAPVSGQLLGYARVSTTAQDESLQLDALAAAGAERVFTDRITGSVLDRPGLDELMAYCRSGDTIVVYSLSRLSRSTRDLLRLADELAARGVGLRSLTEPVDTSTSSPYGQFTLSLLGALAELERGILRERTRDGVAAARARGRVGGRRPVDPSKVSAAADLVAAGRSVAEAAKIVGLGRSTLYRALRDDRHETVPT